MARNAHIRLNIRAVGEDPLDARAIIHGQVKSGNGTIAPAEHCDARDLEMV